MEGPDPREPGVDLDATHVGQPHEGLGPVGGHVLDHPAPMGRVDRDQRHPGRLVAGGLLLVEEGCLGAVGEPGHDDRPILQVGEQHRRGGGVVGDQVAFGVAVGKELLVEVGEPQGVVVTRQGVGVLGLLGPGYGREGDTAARGGASGRFGRAHGCRGAVDLGQDHLVGRRVADSEMTVIRNPVPCAASTRGVTRRSPRPYGRWRISPFSS